MKPLRTVSKSDVVALATAAGTLGLPPTTFGLVPDWWNSSGSIPEIELEIWAPSAVAMTNAVLYGATLHALTFADITITGVAAVKAFLDLGAHTTRVDTIVQDTAGGVGGNATTIAITPDGSVGAAGELDESAYPAVVYKYRTGVTTVTQFEAAITASVHLSVKTPGTGAHLVTSTGDTLVATHLAGGVDAKLHGVAHGLLTGDGPVDVVSTLTLPPPLLGATGYYVVKDDADNIGIALSLTDALTGKVVELTGAGTGTIKLQATVDTERVYWQTHDGLLGLAGDGAIALDAQKGYRKRMPHSPRVIGYALVGTLDTASVSAAIVPIQDASS